jgi:hypothetical protein
MNVTAEVTIVPHPGVPPHDRSCVELRASEGPATGVRPAGALVDRVRAARLGLCHPGRARERRRTRDVRECPPEVQIPEGAPRRSSGRADLISGKPRRRKATAIRPCLPQDSLPRRGRGVGQPRFLGGTRRYLPAHSRAPPRTRARARVRGRARGGADAGRLRTRPPPHP